MTVKNTLPESIRDLKQKLEAINSDLSKFTFAYRFDHYTNGGDGVYHCWLLYQDADRLKDYSYLLWRSKVNFRRNKSGYCIGYTTVKSYLSYYLPELVQLGI